MGVQWTRSPFLGVKQSLRRTGNFLGMNTPIGFAEVLPRRGDPLGLMQTTKQPQRPDRWPRTIIDFWLLQGMQVLDKYLPTVLECTQ